ncbi:permease for cytosine/purines, uracil, thiamine, allantoin-domain-containing protein [Talaromyces proteolyticus]|uniref:Permease for cytosine/purines, uracil, thiamine, allantoin-domain-containing protein n=1 Tax=Talaromyces proteolyticus TaxID=1131652 RepID=A0AAD4KL43_9EURO|nr:permease for cytosine/purines, uracil, thiamine, allantoin-domain-containing protein [Talaromyces proteolyticus]KAH8691666.1 permease for cytosine/purines, uracil, thiamine, allantoin-domain-containing protein [Talaromyces proteolyticus]
MDPVDPEKGHGVTTSAADTKAALDSSSNDEAQPPHRDVAYEQTTSVLGRLRALEHSMDQKFHIESEAIDRKRPEDKRNVSWTEQLSMALLWASGTMNISCFATGFLGWEFGLSLRQSIVITIFASLLGASITGFCATFGAATGLRQISVSRYSFGWWPNKLIALLNSIQQMGWAAVACITGGLALTAVSDGHVSLVVGIIILAVVALIISFVGLNAILVYERYAWVIFFVIFLIIFGETGKYADNTSPASVTGANLGASVLSLLAIVYGSSASWATMASDYYVLYPANVSRVKVFFMTTFGIAIPTSIGMVAGCVAASALNNKPEWHDTYENQGVGYLIQEMLYPRGFAKFLLTLLVLSGINVNVISIYSAAISFQQLSRPFSAIPRFIWTLFCFACILALALGGREELNTYLQDFLSLLGYWCTSYGIILFEEHFIFRKGNFENYDLEGWNSPARLPLGIGAIVAFLLGVIAWCMGMDETWFVGPLAKLIGDGGGDVANEFTFVVTAISYIPARYLELKYFGR